MADQWASAARAWYQKDLEAVQADVLAALQKHWKRVGSQLIAHALIETTGSVLSAIVTENPGTRETIDGKLGDLRLFVSTTDKPPQ